MTAPLSRHIQDALDIPHVNDRIAAALIAGDDAECGRIIREAVGVAMAEWRELEALRAENEADDARELWREMTADVRAHEACE